MQATHVRFALEFEGLLGIVNQGEYLAGVMYPDSRYTTGIDRACTHDYSIEPKDLLTGTDFEKGWKIHVIYDKLGGELLKKVFNIDLIESASSDAWYKVTAAKLYEDIESWRVMGVSADLMSQIVVHDSPNQESKNKIFKWYDLQKDVYTNKPARLEAYQPLLDWYQEIDPTIKERWLNEYDKLVVDPRKCEKVLLIFDQVKQKVHDGLQG